MKESNKSQNEKKNILNSLKKAGITRTFQRKSLNDPYYSSVGKSKKGNLEIRE